MGDWKGRFAGASAPQFLPHNSAPTLIATGMQREFKEEQIGTLFVWIEPQEGGF